MKKIAPTCFALVALDGCQTDDNTSVARNGIGNSSTGDNDMQCVSRLASQTGRPMSAISNQSSEQAGEGTRVKLLLEGDTKWSCYVADIGRISLDQDDWS